MSNPRIPIARPLLVPAESLIPYFREIDTSRVYTNFGPLGRRFEERLCCHFGIEAGGIVPVANATVGLTAALLTVRRQGRDLCVMPAWTFCASAHAAMAAGLRPFFVDVRPNTWQITPQDVAALPGDVLQRVAAVMPVAAFGAPVDGRSWDAFTAATKIPAVIDAAAGFDSLTPTASASVVSLHATKALGIGEGGFVATMEPELGHAIRQRLNFGFRGTRKAAVPAINAKLSEYGCAVGLAALDVWERTRAAWADVRDGYWRRLTAVRRAWFSAVPEQAWVSSTFVLATQSEARQLDAALEAANIDSRRWWEAGCHREPAFATCEATALPTTDRLAACSIGLPFFPDMTNGEIDRVVEAILPHLGRESHPAHATYPAGDVIARSAFNA